jgi:hypothetical protein
MSTHALNQHPAAGCSTGPRTQNGKDTSRWNSFKHGLYAKQLVIPGENPAELDALRASLRAEYQPVNTTEDILVNEIAEQFWRVRRMRNFESCAMEPENFENWSERGLLALVMRQMASAERGMHKAMTTLRRLQLDRGFVPSKNVDHANTATSEPHFVPQNHPEPNLVSQNRSEHLDFVPENVDDSLDNSTIETPDYAPFSPPSHENAA